LEAVEREGCLLAHDGGARGSGSVPKTVVIDATYLKAHCTASSPRVKKGDLGRMIGRTKGGMNTKLHVVVIRMGGP